MILWAGWDPIGDVPRDEYDWYVPRIASSLRQGADEDRLAEELNRYRTERIGLPPDQRADRVVAAKLIDWFTNPFDDDAVRPSELRD